MILNPLTHYNQVHLLSSISKEHKITRFICLSQGACNTRYLQIAQSYLHRRTLSFPHPYCNTIKHLQFCVDKEVWPVGVAEAGI